MADIDAIDIVRILMRLTGVMGGAIISIGIIAIDEGGIYVGRRRAKILMAIGIVVCVSMSVAVGLIM